MNKPSTITVAEAVLKRAMQIIGGNRQKEYGSPENSFAAIAGLMNSIGVRIDGEPIKDRDVALQMMVLKLGREMNQPKIDNMIDLCGYAALRGGITLSAKYHKFRAAMKRTVNPANEEELMQIAESKDVYDVLKLACEMEDADGLG